MFWAALMCTAITTEAGYLDAALLPHCSASVCLLQTFTADCPLWAKWLLWYPLYHCLPAVKHPELLCPDSGSVDVGGQVWFTRHQGSVKQLESVNLNEKRDTADIRRTKWSF